MKHANSSNRLPQQRQESRGMSRSGTSSFAPAFFESSPFNVMRRMQEDMDRLWGQVFGGSLLPTSSMVNQQQQFWSPTMDVSESQNEWCIEADLPGVKDEDIDLQVQNGSLTVRAELSQGNGSQKEQKGEQTNQSDTSRRYHQQERRYGYFERMLTLPENVNEDDVSAEFKNGVLTIHLPKKQQGQQQGRRIPIQQNMQSSAQQGQRQQQKNVPEQNGSQSQQTGAHH